MKWINMPRARSRLRLQILCPLIVLGAFPAGDHQTFVDRATLYLNKLAAENDIAVDSIDETGPIDKEFLARYKLFIQLNYPPYRWTPAAKQALKDYIAQGKGDGSASTTPRCSANSMDARWAPKSTAPIRWSGPTRDTRPVMFTSSWATTAVYSTVLNSCSPFRNAIFWGTGQ
jgi:hypothetical protein